MSKVINLLLDNGTANGLIKCTRFSWTGVVYKIPRSQLQSCEGREELKYKGVCFLFGDNDWGIVHGENILNYLQSIDFNWNEAIVCTMSDNSLREVDVSYIAKKFRDLVVSAKRYTFKSGGNFSQINITEERECELDEFVENAENIIATLGYKIFVPPKNSAQENIPPADKIDDEVAESNGIIFWYLEQSHTFGDKYIKFLVDRNALLERYKAALAVNADKVHVMVAKNLLSNANAPETAEDTSPVEEIEPEEIDDDANGEMFEMFGVMTTSNFGVDFTVRKSGDHIGHKDWRIDGKHFYEGKSVSKALAHDVFFERYRAATGNASVDIPAEETFTAEIANEEEALAIADAIENVAAKSISDEILAKVKRYGLTTLERINGVNEGLVEWCIDGKRNYQGQPVTKALAAEIFIERYNNPDDIPAEEIPVETKNKQVTPVVEKPAIPADNAPLTLYLKQKVQGTNFIIDATCVRFSENVFVVRRGSRISPYVTKYFRGKPVRRPRPSSKDISNNVLLKDMVFKKSSAAASFVVGHSASGNATWKNAEGVPLKDILNN